MGEEIEALYVLLGMKTDEPGVADAVNKMVKTVQQKLKSSIYGGENGVITLPATIEGTYKNGKEIEKEIKDAYAAIYAKAKQMADESVSLTLKDIEDFKKQIDKFGKITSKKRSSDIIANMNNNLQQTMAAYRDLVNDLKKQINTQQKQVNKKSEISKNKSQTTIDKKEQQKYDKYKITKPMDFPTDTSFNRKGYGTIKTLFDSKRGGPYRTPYNQQVADSKREAKKTYEKESYKEETDKIKATKSAENAFVQLREETERLTKVVKEGTKLVPKTITETFERVKKIQPNSKLTDQEKALEKANLAMNEATHVLGGIEHGRKGATSENFKMFTNATSDFMDKAGKTKWDTMDLTLNKAMNRYHGMSGDTLGVGYDQTKGEYEHHEKANEALKDLMDTFTDTMKDANDSLAIYEAQQRKIYAKLKAWGDIDKLDKGSKKSKTKTADKNNTLLMQEINKSQKAINNVADMVKGTTKAVDENQKAVIAQTSFDKIENSAERAADSASGRKTETLISDAEADLSSGFNTDTKANDAIKAIQEIGSYRDLLKSILAEIQGISKNGINVVGVKTKDIVKSAGFDKKLYESIQSVLKPMNQLMLPAGKTPLALPEPNGEVSSSTVTTTVKDPASWFTKLKDKFAELTKTTANYKVIMAKTSEEQDKMSAERIKTFGLNRGRSPVDSGDKISFARSMSLWRGKDKFKDLFKDVNLSEGITFDTTAITDKLAKVLSGKEMFKAQTGGWKNNILGAMTGGLSFAFTPSLEKTRAQIEGLNQVMANVRKAANDTIQDIQSKESTLRGMQKTGDLKLGKNGEVLEGSTKEAKTLVLQLEESKQALVSILADVGMIDQVVSRTHGRTKKIRQQLGFTSPVLRENNTILANINAGLDKNGKALKFQNRLAELLNYTFQLMSRHIGQLFKNWLLMLNPMNLIKKIFKDFMSYDAKWQRTMNVIKYNLRTIVKPIVQWIAQQLVNVIGFLDIISMKIQSAFNRTPISVFDQAAADSEKINEELEAAAGTVSAGFDELHDIGSDNAGANDLLGDIYKPQLSKEWEDLANKIGDLFKGIITGDLGFGDVMQKIFEIAGDVMKKILGKVGDLLGDIASKVWGWFKETDFGKWITNNWTKLLDKILQIFVAWKLLKIAGSALLNALFGALTPTAIGSIFKNVGNWILTALGATAFGAGIIEGIKTFAGGGLLATLKSIFVGSDIITAFGAWGETLGALFAQSFIAIAGVTIGVGMVASARESALNKDAYNRGLMQSGGKEEDKQNKLGDVLWGAGGGAIAGATIGSIVPAIGTGIGAIIGAIVGALTVETTPLNDAFGELASKIKEMNNELLATSEYEGRVKGFTTQVEGLDTQVGLLTGTYDKNLESLVKQGEKLGISKDRMNELVEAIKNGTYESDQLSGKEVELKDSLDQLDWSQKKVKETSEKLTEAKRKLQKAEMDLAIAQDIEAGNFELAQARIEYALASEVYSGEEAARQMNAITKQASDDIKANMLKDMSPDLKAQWEKYVKETDQGKDDLLEIINKMNKEEQEAFSTDYADEVRAAMQRTLSALQQTINSSGAFSIKGAIARTSKDLLVRAAREKGINLASLDVGTNYVPNDGLAYLHKGEAVIPADQNEFAKQGEAFNAQSVTNTRLINAITSLEMQLRQGVKVNGEFRQRGSDLVATVNKNNSQMGANLMSNASYAR